MQFVFRTEEGQRGRFQSCFQAPFGSGGLIAILFLNRIGSGKLISIDVGDRFGEGGADCIEARVARGDFRIRGRGTCVPFAAFKHGFHCKVFMLL